MRGEGKKTKNDIPKNDGEAKKKSSFVEINPSGFPKMRKKRNLRRGAQGWEMAGEGKWPTVQAHKRIKFFFKSFCLGDVHSPDIFSSWDGELKCI